MPFALRHCWRAPARDIHGRRATLAATWTAQLGIPRYCGCHAQLAYYRLLEGRGEIRLLKSREDLADHWSLWQSAADRSRLPIGVILSMEGADPIHDPGQLTYWWEQGLRAIGPAHYGHSHYSAGTNAEGGLTVAGRELLGEMQRLGVVLDVTHLSDQGMSGSP